MATAPLSGTTACVFDAYGTLFDTGAAIARCRDAIGEKADALAALWRSKQLEYSWQLSLRGDYVDFWHLTGAGLDYAMAALNIDDLALRSRLMELYFALDPYPDALGALTALRDSGRKVAILSNGSPSMLTAAVRRAAFEPLLDAVISVEPLRIYKPHPNVYQSAVDRLGVARDEICFMSSNYWDVSGAALFGFRVVWINRQNSIPDRLPGAPEQIVASLADLPALLGVAASAEA